MSPGKGTTSNSSGGNGKRGYGQPHGPTLTEVRRQIEKSNQRAERAKGNNLEAVIPEMDVIAKNHPAKRFWKDLPIQVSPGQMAQERDSAKRPQGAKPTEHDNNGKRKRKEDPASPNWTCQETQTRTRT